MIALGAVMLAFPAEGIKMGSAGTVYFPSFEDVFGQDEPQKDISTILQDSVVAEVDPRLDSIKLVRKADSIRKWQLRLHYRDNDKSVLYPFYSALGKAKRASKPVRIIHYGDSQIEGDRISGILRSRLQREFGGSGPGYLPAVPLTGTSSIRQSFSDNWQRYTIFGIKDTTITHNRFGMLGNLGRFTPIRPDSVPIDSVSHNAEIVFSKNRRTFMFPAKPIWFKMFYGNYDLPVGFKLHVNDSLLFTDSLASEMNHKIFKRKFSPAPNSIKVEFEGRESPEIYGFSIEGTNGVIVDNVPLRGSSGTIFRKVDRDLLIKIYNDSNVKLLIMQFGGNVMPYIDSDSEIQSYGRWFESNLRLLKEIIPGVSIVVVGPSDMSHKPKVSWQTFGHLPDVRDRLKEAAFNTGCAYWDLYEAMGGENSMPQWVATDPPLAVNDHVHFTRKGANKVAQWLYDAIIADYREYETKLANEN